MSRSPFHYSFDLLNSLKGKFVRITMDRPIKINGTNIESTELIGYYHDINVNHPAPSYPMYLSFIHKELSSDVTVNNPNGGTTPVNLSDMASIESAEKL